MRLVELVAHNAARAKLAAAAPEMARMLALLEWCGPWSAEDGPTCSRCRASRYYDGGAGEHRSDCAWVALMRKAGVLP